VRQGKSASCNDSLFVNAILIIMESMASEAKLRMNEFSQQNLVGCPQCQPLSRTALSACTLSSNRQAVLRRVSKNPLKYNLSLEEGIREVLFCCACTLCQACWGPAARRIQLPGEKHEGSPN
jgi:hypothetical protein